MRDSLFGVSLIETHFFTFRKGFTIMKRLSPLPIFTLLIMTNIFVLSACNIDNSSTTDNASTNSTNYNPIDYPTNNSCIHNWGAPTCLEPAQCTKCDAYKTDGKLGNHAWLKPTCIRPAMCEFCYEYKDDILGHHYFTDDNTCLYCNISKDEHDKTKE